MNILLDSEFNVQICDFGLARTLYPYSLDFQNFNTSIVRENNSKRYKNETDKKSLMMTNIATYMNHTRKRRKEQKRKLSNGTGTRWYRSPEISLSERTYD